jgi:phage replication O-like protein O
MATPQTSDGYTRTANELMEAECKLELSGNEWRVYNAVKRLTYGWNKKEDRIAYSVISELTGLGRNRIFEAVQNLVFRNVLLSRKTGTHSPQILGIQKNFKRWELSRKNGMSRKTGTDCTAKPVHSYPGKPAPPKTVKTTKEKTLPASDDAVPIVFYMTKKKKKLTGKRLTTFEIFWEAFAYRRGKAEAADSWREIPSLTGKLCAEIYEAAKIEAANRDPEECTPKMAQGWLSSRRWEDKDLTPAVGGGKHGRMPKL